MEILVPALVFLLGAGLVVGGYIAAVRLPGRMNERRIQGRLDELSHYTPGSQDADGDGFTLVKEQAGGPLPGLDRLAAQTSAGAGIARLIEQSGMKVGVSTIVLASLSLAVVVGFGAAVILREVWGLLPGGALGAAMPFLVLIRRRNVRMRTFEEQFPEALDLLSRAIRAGHAFTTAMSMVAEEARDPIGPEFKKTFDEQNYGLPLKDAMNNMTHRIPLLDVRFFVTAVLIQRETGGNLSEILDNLSYVVRERFKILRQVRVYTAHGRLTGYVLMGLPAALAIALSFINPDHINLLFTEKMGRAMIASAIVMQTVGYIWIRKVVTIEV